MAVTRDDVVTKFDALPDTGTIRALGSDYNIVCTKDEETPANPPLIVAVQPLDGSTHVFLQHQNDDTPEPYVEGPWEALITA